MFAQRGCLKWLQRSARLAQLGLNIALRFIESMDTVMPHNPLLSTDSAIRFDPIDRGILRSATEREASLIVCGWKGFSTTRDNFFGSIIDNVVRRSPVPVLIARFPNPIQNTARVILAITDSELTRFGFQETVDIAKSLAQELKATKASGVGGYTRGKKQQKCVGGGNSF